MASPPATVVVPTVLVDGQPLDAALAIVAIDVEREVNRIPTAQLVLALEGRVADQPALMSAAPFAPGAEMEIKLRPADEDVSVFKGIIVGLALTVGAAAPRLRIEAKDRAIRLTQKRQARVFADVSDADAIATILNDAGIDVGELPATEPVYPVLVQSYATDWDFIVSRADAQGLVVTCEDGVVSLRPMAIDGSPQHAFAIASGGIERVEFELDARHQHPGIVAAGWSPEELAPAEPEQAETLALPQGGIGTNTIGGELGFATFALTHMVPMAAAEAKSWADARMARSRLALIRGRLRTGGRVDIKPMQLASVADLGERFDGTALITGIRHGLDAGGFRTDVQFGLSPTPFSRRVDVNDVPAAGLLPAATALQLGRVTDIADPDNLMRVKVMVPAVGADAELWARVATPDAGDQRGIVFRPEAGDEVVVGFLGNDPRHPVIIGRLHGAKNAPPDALADNSADNVAKGIVTRSGCALLFADEDKPSITITTPAGNALRLDDDGKRLTLSDENGNEITLSEGGITMKTGKEFKIEAGGKVSIKGQEVNLN